MNIQPARYLSPQESHAWALHPTTQEPLLYLLCRFEEDVVHLLVFFCLFLLRGWSPPPLVGQPRAKLAAPCRLEDQKTAPDPVDAPQGEI